MCRHATAQRAAAHASAGEAGTTPSSLKQSSASHLLTPPVEESFLGMSGGEEEESAAAAVASRTRPCNVSFMRAWSRRPFSPPCAARPSYTQRGSAHSAIR